MTQKYSSNAQVLISKSALLANLATYRALLEKKTKLLLMVKANGYGSDALMIAKATENKVDYLGVAFPSTGYKLREKGICAPIFVMASTPEELGRLAKENLEPVLYSLAMIKSAVALNAEIKVHLEIDAGMKRLGLLTEDLPEVISLLNHSKITVVSAFAHVVAPGEPKHDEFTHQQAAYFNTCFEKLYLGLTTKPFKHLMPTGGAIRFKQYQYDMVRLGIGIYGYDSASQLNNQLKTVSTFQCNILQVLNVKKGETIGYNRKGNLPKGGKIATLSVGYGDGYLRIFGNGNAEVFVNGKRAKTIGTICMDLVMIDVTHIDCKPGDTVEMFGSNIGIEELAIKANTIPYEILTNISPRVERTMVD